ncbi:hypothetical protein BHE74_00026738 [Ensete ventricosum]|nr:hypothetical protein BHE74_00026738 [Ensete ventricosum]
MELRAVPDPSDGHYMHISSSPNHLGARSTFPSGKKHATRLATRTIEAATKYDGMVSNRCSKDLRYGRLVAFTIKAPAPLRRGGSQNRQPN